MNEELKKIKKRYGEGMAKLCRDLFPTLIEQGILFDILSSSFQENRSLSEDIIENRLSGSFRTYINNKAKKENIENTFIDKTPSELLNMAGYQLFECKTEEDIQSFKHYFKSDEELCTFLGGRLESNYVFFAIKDNVNKIIRENFTEPLRQDEYGTSVISIQFRRKSPNYLSIKNRYNHAVPNSCSTFSNNLDNIIEGLNESFEKEYNLDFVRHFRDFEIPNYVRADNGKFYKYNYEINNIYYCSNNIIIDNGKVIEYDKSKYLLVDYFLMDLKNKSLSLYDNYINEDFINHLEDIDKIEIKNLDTAKTKKGEKQIIITRNDRTKIELKINKHNQMISLDSDDITEIGDDFLYENKYLSKMSLSSVKSIKSLFLENNQILIELSLPSVKIIGNNCLTKNKKLSKIDLPSVKEIEDQFLYSNEIIDDVRAPLLEKVGDRFLINNKALIKLNLPSVNEIGNSCLWQNRVLDEINAPFLEIIGSGFLKKNEALINLNLTSLKRIDYWGFFKNFSLRDLYLPEVEHIGENSFKNHSIYSKMTAEEIHEKSIKDKKKRLEEQVVAKDKNDGNDKEENYERTI